MCLLRIYLYLFILSLFSAVEHVRDLYTIIIVKRIYHHESAPSNITQVHLLHPPFIFETVFSLKQGYPWEGYAGLYMKLT